MSTNADEQRPKDAAPSSHGAGAQSSATNDDTPAATVKAWADAVFEPESTVEVRFIWPDRDAGKPPISRWWRAKDLHTPRPIAEMSRMNREGWGVYCGANPRKKSGGRDATSVEHALTLCADFDGGPTVEGVNRRIRDGGLPPATVLVESGHGVHAYWRLESPITDLAEWTRRQKGIINAVGSDRSINDPPRVMRIPGFTNTKPPVAPAALVEVHSGRVYPAIEFAEAETVVRTESAPQKETFTEHRKKLSRRTLDFIVHGTSDRDRHTRVYAAASDMKACGHPIEEAIAKLVPAAINSPGDHPFTETEGVETIGDAYKGDPRPAIPGQERTAHGRAMLVTLADVTPEEVRWLWQNVIPLGKLTCIAGDPGLGKSFITLDLAARVSRGRAMPGELDEGDTEPGGVVLLSAEDDLADTIRPRLDAVGADVTRITAISGVEYTPGAPPGSFTLADVPALEDAIKRTAECRLVIIDPITAYMGRADAHRNDEVRALLAPLSSLAARHHVAIVFVSHLNKSSGMKSAYRVTGSLAVVAAARSAWLVIADPDNRDGRLFLPVKANLAARPSGLAFAVTGDPPAVAWSDQPVNKTADDILAAEAAPTKGSSAVDDAAHFLRELLADGRPIPVVDVEKQAASAGVSKAALKRARAKLGLRPKRTGYGPGKEWTLALPSRHCGAEASVEAQTPEVSDNGVHEPQRDDVTPFPADQPTEALFDASANPPDSWHR